MRNKFIESLVQMAEDNEKVILIVGDLGFSVVEPFQEKFPDRFINAGICEQNMTSLAAGMAKEGFKVFIYSIGNFPTFRAAEQIRNDICYHHLDVTIVTVGGGLAYGNLGYSHHSIQDYGLMRLFPEMTIISPGDPNEVESCMNFIRTDVSPKYLRLRKAGEINYSKEKSKLNPGIWNPIKLKNPRKILLSTGHGMQLAIDKIKEDESFKEFSLYSCPIWGYKYDNLQSRQILNFDIIITIEDHLKAGGFGSWINENSNYKIKNISLSHDVIGKVGSEKYLLQFLN